MNFFAKKNRVYISLDSEDLNRDIPDLVNDMSAAPLVKAVQVDLKLTDIDDMSMAATAACIALARKVHDLEGSIVLTASEELVTRVQTLKIANQFDEVAVFSE